MARAIKTGKLWRVKLAMGSGTMESIGKSCLDWELIGETSPEPPSLWSPFADALQVKWKRDDSNHYHASSLSIAFCRFRVTGGRPSQPAAFCTAL